MAGLGRVEGGAGPAELPLGAALNGVVQTRQFRVNGVDAHRRLL